jgi:hypothetical protein
MTPAEKLIYDDGLRQGRSEVIQWLLDQPGSDAEHYAEGYRAVHGDLLPREPPEAAHTD